jgi:hypothetical protein
MSAPRSKSDFSDLQVLVGIIVDLADLPYFLLISVSGPGGDSIWPWVDGGRREFQLENEWTKDESNK